MTDHRPWLGEYSRTGSEAAFRELVTRYLDLVYSTALRLLDGDAHRAEDAAQTVFIDLARMALGLPPDVMLGGWLHRHTCFVVSNLLRKERRRRAREIKAVEMNSMHDSSENRLAQFGPALDEAIDQLGSEDRSAILLRFFDQLEFRAVGQALGTTEEAARKRVSRALDKLHTLLTARGVVISTTSLAAALVAEAVQSAPAGLGAAITGTAMASMIGSGTTLSVLKTMAVSKIGVGLAGAALVASIAFSARQYHVGTALRAQSAALRQQLSQAAAQIDDLSNRLGQTTMVTSTRSESFNELMRLRGEVASLRRQVDAANLHGLTSDLSPASPEPDPADQIQQMGITKMRNAKIWCDAIYAFAGRNGNMFPTNFDQVTKQLHNALRNDLNPGEVLRETSNFLQSTNDFEIVYQGSATNIVSNMSSAMVMREKDPWQTPNGEWNRTYGFADGHTEIHHASDGDFSRWEAQYLVSPSAP